MKTDGTWQVLQKCKQRIRETCMQQLECKLANLLQPLYAVSNTFIDIHRWELLRSGKLFEGSKRREVSRDKYWQPASDVRLFNSGLWLGRTPSWSDPFSGQWRDWKLTKIPRLCSVLWRFPCSKWLFLAVKTCWHLGRMASNQDVIVLQPLAARLRVCRVTFCVCCKNSSCVCLLPCWSPQLHVLTLLLQLDRQKQTLKAGGRVWIVRLFQFNSTGNRLMW